MTSPVVRMASEYALVMDVGGKSAIVCNREGLCYQVVTQYPILTGDINENGWITLIGEDALQHEIRVFKRGESGVTANDVRHLGWTAYGGNFK